METPSLLLMRMGPVEYIDPLTQPEQLSFWPCEVKEFTLRAPGPEYPWYFHERVQYYKARCIHPAVAMIMAEEDVQHKQAEDERNERRLKPTLFVA